MATPGPLQEAEFRPTKRQRTTGLNARMDSMLARIDDSPTSTHSTRSTRSTRSSRSSSFGPNDSFPKTPPHPDSDFSTTKPDRTSTWRQKDSKRTKPDPLPAWLFDTFSQLEEDHPLRSIVHPPQQPATDLNHNTNWPLPQPVPEEAPIFAFSVPPQTPASSTKFISDFSSAKNPPKSSISLPFSTPGPGAHPSVHTHVTSGTDSRLPSLSLPSTRSPPNNHPPDNCNPLYYATDDSASDPPLYDFSFIDHIPFSTPGPTYSPTHFDWPTEDTSYSDPVDDVQERTPAAAAVDLDWEPMTLDETYQAQEFPIETLDEYDMAPDFSALAVPTTTLMLNSPSRNQENTKESMSSQLSDDSIQSWRDMM